MQRGWRSTSAILLNSAAEVAGSLLGVSLACDSLVPAQPTSPSATRIAERHIDSLPVSCVQRLISLRATHASPDQGQTIPPFARITWPLIQPASMPARNALTDALSSGSSIGPR